MFMVKVADPQKSHKVNRKNLRLVVCTVQLGPPGVHKVTTSIGSKQELN